MALNESYLYVILWIKTDSCLLSHMSYCSTYMTSNYFQSEIEVTTAAPSAVSVEVPISLFVVPLLCAFATFCATFP